MHHIIHRAHGGTNDEWNLIVLCSGHHKLHHDGVLEILGRAPDQVRFVRLGAELPAGTMSGDIRGLGDAREVRKLVLDRPASNHQSQSRAVGMSVRNPNAEDARVALTTLGYTTSVAKRAVEAACAEDGVETLERLLKAALRHC